MFFFFKKKIKKINSNLFSNSVTDEITKTVTDFYSKHPFPNYKENDDKISILNKGNKNILAKSFKKFIGYKKNVLEVGSGTGQLGIYLAIGSNNNIICLDPTLASLKLASNFAIENKINNIKFINCDLFDDVMNDNSFDFVWCSGVLHHTKDPRKGFEIICKSLKNEGYIVVGLYNKYGRFRTLFRALVFKLLGIKLVSFLDPTLRNLKLDKNETNAWIQDQYNHPVESLHTLDEVNDWFLENHIEFINSIPASNLSDIKKENIFQKQSRGNFFSRLISQIFMIFNKLGSDGGLFVVIGKKNV